MAEVECVVRMRNSFGESPVWSAGEQALYWVDVKAPAVHRLTPSNGEVQTWPMLEDIGSIALRRAGGVIAGMRSGFYIVDLSTATRALVSNSLLNEPKLRFNDGKCDRAGRFWCGTLDDSDFQPVGSLYRLDANRNCQEFEGGFILINGIAWSPDNKTMYVADSRREIVYQYEFSLSDGTIANRRPFISTASVPGRVDGATAAADGTYWCAHVRGGQVAQYDPAGKLIQAISLPVKYPLMCTFGGPAMDVLFVTTSAAMVTPDESRDQPLAGSLFAVHGTGSTGIPEPFYAG